MLPNTTEQWKNDDGKSVLVKCINATKPMENMTDVNSTEKPTDNMTDVNSTDARNETSFQVSLQGEQLQIHFFISWTFFKNDLLLFIYRFRCR